jgi:hypothetical protein
LSAIAIYVEGGGSTNATKSLLRAGFSVFFREIRELARNKAIQWRIIPCGGRGETYGAFVDAVKKEPEILNILLVDSEEPVSIDASPWCHLAKRQLGGWAKPAGADDRRCHMMVACMEAWFLADPDGLTRHFSGNFDRVKLPTANLAESRTKADITDALKQATRNTKAKEYQKIRDGAKLLEKINPVEVRKHCRWCERLFVELERAIRSKA